MTNLFDSFIESVLSTVIIEKTARCNGPTLRQLSDKPGFRFMACKPNPYSYGFKRVFWGRRDGSFDFSKCKRNPRRGTEAGETCADLRRALIKRMKRRKHK